MKLYLRNQFLELEEPVIMGILNITPDSFSDGGKYLGAAAAMRQAEKLVTDGAAIIDVGGESTRPGARRVGVDEEIDRVIPVIEKIKETWDVLVSIDTYKENVARLAVEEADADMVNDISALMYSEAMAETVSELNVPVVLMHIKGTPETMQQAPSYTDVVAEIKDFFEERIEFALARGIKKEKLILDPGIGFGKRVEDNIAILKNLRAFAEFELPLMAGISRKSFLGAISGEKIPAQRDAETTAAHILAMSNGASMLRVHDVAQAVKTVKIFKAMF